jgi:hypothetical protein
MIENPPSDNICTISICDEFYPPNVLWRAVKSAEINATVIPLDEDSSFGNTAIFGYF